MDLAALTIFRAVVQENGITRAAAKLNRVQSNVTARIKQLEEQVGTPLFVRDGRRLVLTPAGETLLPYAERLLALAEEARHALQAERPSGRLALGTMESTAAARLPSILARYHQQWPEVAIELTTGTSGCLIERVRKFEIDAALVARLPEPMSLDTTIEAVPVFRETLVMMTPLGAGAVRTPADAANATLIAFERGCAYRGYAQQWYAAHGARPARVLELGSYHAIVACVAAGAGVAVAPYSVLACLGPTQQGPGGIAVHALPEIPPIDTLLIWRRGHFSAALDALRAALLNEDGAAPAAAPHAAPRARRRAGARPTAPAA